MSEDVKAWFNDYMSTSGRVKEIAPDAINGFGGMFARIMKDGVISLKNKELIAIGIAVGIQCEPCIRLHVKKCLDAGCTKEEIMEASSVAVMMSGGPAYTHLNMVLETIEAMQD